MKLKNVQITKYKCVEDSTPWKVDQGTTLVGKNEAGKSTLLEALYKLNPVEDNASNFHTNDYPRRYALTDLGKEDSKVAMAHDLRLASRRLRTTVEHLLKNALERSAAK